MQWRLQLQKNCLQIDSRSNRLARNRPLGWTNNKENDYIWIVVRPSVCAHCLITYNWRLILISILIFIFIKIYFISSGTFTRVPNILAVETTKNRIHFHLVRVVQELYICLMEKIGVCRMKKNMVKIFDFYFQQN